jgi:hypothetical protein
LDLLVRLKGTVNETDAMTDTTYLNQDLFAVYAQRLFKRSDFDMLAMMRDGLDDRGIESAKNQYFQFWHKRSGHTFWVKYEFRCDDKDKLDWPCPDQLKCYREFQDNVWPEKVYLIMGFGGRPLRPSFMFCVPLDEVGNYIRNPFVLEKFERGPSRPFDFQRGLLT